MHNPQPLVLPRADLQDALAKPPPFTCDVAVRKNGQNKTLPIDLVPASLSETTPLIAASCFKHELNTANSKKLLKLLRAVGGRERFASKNGSKALGAVRRAAWKLASGWPLEARLRLAGIDDSSLVGDTKSTNPPSFLGADAEASFDPAKTHASIKTSVAECYTHASVHGADLARYSPSETSYHLTRAKRWGHCVLHFLRVPRDEAGRADVTSMSKQNELDMLAGRAVDPGEEKLNRPGHGVADNVDTCFFNAETVKLWFETQPAITTLSVERLTFDPKTLHAAIVHHETELNDHEEALGAAAQFAEQDPMAPPALPTSRSVLLEQAKNAARKLKKFSPDAKVRMCRV